MTLPQPSLLRDWHRQRFQYFERCAEDSTRAMQRFMSDWGLDAGIRVVGQPSVRIKSVERIWAKIRRRAASDSTLEMLDFDELLQRQSVAGDLIGVRLVVRGLDDLEALHSLMESNDFLSDAPFAQAEFDAKYRNPSKTGYRALHIDSGADIAIKGQSFRIPVEFQVKTGLQDQWGTFTHDTAYELTELHDDPQFRRLRELQRLLSDSLDIADQLNRSVDELYADFVSSRGLVPVNSESALSLDVVLRLFVESLDVVLSLVDARRVLDAATFSGLNTADGLRQIILNQELLDLMASDIQKLEGRKATSIELVIVAIESADRCD